jgi:hypothetical protein
VTAKDRWQGVRVTAFAFRQLCIDLIFAFIWADRLYIHGEHKRTLQFQNDAENKFGVLRTYTHSSQQKSQSFVSNDLSDCCCCEPQLDATSFENGYSTTRELVCSAVSKDSCAMCIFLQFHVELPRRVSIYAWYKKFKQKECSCKGKSPGWLSVCAATVDLCCGVAISKTSGI